MPDRLRELLDTIVASPFYARKLDGRKPQSLDDCSFTTKAELVADQTASPPYGTNFTRPLADFVRLHQTSGSTTGKPLRWLDTPESWDWLLGCWRTTFSWIGFQPGERVFFAFSFGPFLGFWTAFEAAQREGHLVFAGGGMTTPARLRFLVEHRTSIVMCTPTYALHLAESAETERVDLANSNVRAVVVAGEPGGLVPEIRERLARSWGARIIDHYGMTEIGPVAAEHSDEPGAMRVLEHDYVAEVIDPDTLAPAADGAVGELVLTNLGRLGSPLVRYRTGDLVRAERSESGLKLVGGILGRTDDMFHVRGNNLYPAAIEAILRRFPDLAEYRIEVDTSRVLTEMAIVVEPRPGIDGRQLADRVAKEIREDLLFRADVTAVEPGSLPRFEMKAKRFVRREKSG